MKISIKQKILSYLQEHPGWVYGGVIEDYIRQTDGHKASNASRRCRELQDEGKIERRIKDGVVQYRWAVPSKGIVGRLERIVIDSSRPAPMLKSNTCCYSITQFSTHDRNCEKTKETTISTLF